MKIHSIVFVAFFALQAIIRAQLPTPAATPRPNPFLDRPTATGDIPGVISRAVLGGSGHPWVFTNLVAVVPSGRDWNDRIKPLAAEALRGVTDLGFLQYDAIGYIVLDADTDVAFDLENTTAMVNGKNFGTGKCTQKLKKGRHAIELKRADWAQPQGDFKITDSVSGKSVVYYTQDLLKKELARSEKVEKKTLPSKLIGDAAGTQPPR
jgi:hypothetical protein